jgi:hypothetical protein
MALDMGAWKGAWFEGTQGTRKNQMRRASRAVKALAHGQVRTAIAQHAARTPLPAAAPRSP